MKLLSIVAFTFTSFLCNATDTNVDPMPKKKNIQIIPAITVRDANVRQKEAAFLFKILWTQNKK